MPDTFSVPVLSLPGYIQFFHLKTTLTMKPLRPLLTPKPVLPLDSPVRAALDGTRPKLVRVKR